MKSHKAVRRMFERYRERSAALRDPPVRDKPPREYGYVDRQDDLEWLAYYEGYRAAERAAKRRASSSGDTKP